MSDSLAFCPRCRKETLFVEAGAFRKCSVCGVQFAISPPSRPDMSVGLEVMGVVQILFRVLLIMAAIVVVGIGVLFAGCALLASGGHF